MTSKYVDLTKIYRWCHDRGGGLVIADSLEEAINKLQTKYGDYLKNLLIWEWLNDDYHDEEDPDVFDIYS